MDRFVEAVLLGLSSGAIYALVALGLVVVFRGTGHLNFAAGEMATLLRVDKDAVLADPAACARDAARALGAQLLLKGARSHLAAPDGRAWRHDGPPEGLPGLACSGSGDVLAGLIAGLSARGASPEQAAAWGVALHAMAARRLARRLGPIGYLARELAAEVPALMRRHGRGD